MPPISKKRGSSFMATTTHVVVFKEALDRNAKPEIFTCTAAEASEIQELLDRVCNEGDGPVGSLSYTEFVEQVEPIALSQLKDRFEDELASLEEEEAEV